MSVCPNHNWECYPYSTDRGHVTVGFHTDADKIDKGQYPFCARVIITIKAPDHTGGPAQNEAQVLWDMEDRLVECLDAAAVPCLLLGRLTHSGCRELVFQVSDYTQFRPEVGLWMSQHDDYEFEVSEHDGWDFYFDSVWPSEQSWMLIYDRRVVDSLVKAGSDPAKPHSLEFVFRGDPDRLEKLQRSLADRGYALLDLSSDESRLIMAYCIPLSVNAIFREGLAHREECRTLGLDFEGWGAMTVK